MITVTGASGKTGSKVAELLLKKNEKVRAIGRSAEHLRNLADQGAEILIGDQCDVKFLTQAFTGVDAAYVLIPPKMDTDNNRKYYKEMSKVIVKAVKASKLKKLVFLSSLGAERKSGTGPVLGLHDAEDALSSLKKVDIVFLRVGYFFENILSTLPVIKAKKVNSNVAAPDAPVLMVSTGTSRSGPRIFSLTAPSGAMR